LPLSFNVSVSLDDLVLARVRQFFRDRVPVSLRDAAMITRSDAAWVLAQIENPERAAAGDAIPWPEVVAIVQRTWTPADLDAAAGTIDGFPTLLRMSLVHWRLPAYLVIALEHIVVEMRADSPEGETLTVESYVARLLDLFMDMDRVQRLCSDPAFRDAFEFPDREES
jgi:hypothetical protein